MRSIIERHLASRFARYFINMLMISFLLLWVAGSYFSLSPMVAAQVEIAKNGINGIFLIELLLRVYVYRGQFFQKMFPVKMPKKKAAPAEDSAI